MTTGLSLSVTAGVTATVPYTRITTFIGSSYAYPIQVRWAASDPLNPDTDSLNPGRKPKATSNKSVAGPTPTVIAKNGLTTGQKAGIGVGVAFAGVLLILLTAFFAIRWLRRRRERFNHNNLDQAVSAGKR